MQNFEFKETKLKDAYIISNFFSSDGRGWFSKDFEKEIFLSNGISFSVTETFTSLSMKNVIRGLHFQTHNPQSKLVTVVSGKALDVIVDLRPYSDTYKQWISFELSNDNHYSLFIPRGFAHGFISLEDYTVMLYQCDGAYDSKSDSGIKFDDPNIGIDWPINLEYAILSDKDKNLQTFEDYLKNPMTL